MAILKIKKIIEDLENNTNQVLGSVTKNTATATLATSAGKAGTAQYATASLVAYYASSGTGKLSGTSSFYSSGMV